MLINQFLMLKFLFLLIFILFSLYYMILYIYILNKILSLDILDKKCGLEKKPTNWTKTNYKSFMVFMFILY